MNVCPECGHPLAAGEGASLYGLLRDALAQAPDGATTRELAGLVGRRESTVAAALAMLETEGVVLRTEAGEGRGWRARRWKLA